MNVRYRVDLSQIERTALRALLSGGKHASRKLDELLPWNWRQLNFRNRQAACLLHLHPASNHAAVLTGC